MKRPLLGFLCLGQAHSEYPDVSLCLSKHGFDSHLIDLNNNGPINWDEYSLINVRECRGYHLDPDFLHNLEVLENRLGNTPITNSPAIIRAAIDKGKYHKKLEQEGVDTIPTFWLKRGACELVVPRLFLREGQAFEKYAIAIKKRIIAS